MKSAKQREPSALPSLNGEAGKEYLERNGTFQSLVEAVRRADKQPDAPAAPFSLSRKINASDGAMSDQFGYSIAASGSAIVVGSSLDDAGAGIAQGSAYVFDRNTGGANNWAQVKKLVAPDAAAQDFFGRSIAISGDTAFVGSPGKGAVYVFERNASGLNNWGEVKKLVHADGTADDEFGWDVAVGGNTAIVAAPGKNSQQGAAYVFEKNAGGANNWGQVNKLTASDGAANDWFGNAVAVSGDTFLIGAYLANAPSAPSTEKQSDNLLGGNTKGAGYIFRGSAVLAPTAANVSVGGRILTADGSGIGNARATLTGAIGETRTAITNPFGYYRFDEVQAGGTYVFAVSHKRYRFAPQILSVAEEIGDLNFTVEK